MKSVSLQLVAVYFLVGSISAANAQSRCDCSVIVDRCRASISEIAPGSVGSRFLIKADTEHCAIIEWTIGDQQGQTTVWDDGEEIDLLKVGLGGKRVNSCGVCRDRLRERSETRIGNAAQDAASLEAAFDASALNSAFSDLREEEQAKMAAQRQREEELRATQRIGRDVSGPFSDKSVRIVNTNE